MTRILLQTTIPHTENDWHIGRFSLLTNLLASMNGVEVTARDRTTDSEGNDPILSTLGTSDFDQLWLFGVDGGEGITTGDCEGITAFVQRGGGLLSARDHDDCGSSICNLGGIGAAHFFHSRNVSPDASRRVRDDQQNTTIDWPNYHSGNNGDYQAVAAPGEVHPLLRRADDSAIEWFPAHPHEGEVGVPEGESNARVIAIGTSKSTARPFNLIVALEVTSDRGRGLAHASFHHFLDYNWDIAAGCPSFVKEAPGDELTRYPERLNDIRTYVQNAVRWLSR